jgi:hypothetical protein
MLLGRLDIARAAMKPSAGMLVPSAIVASLPGVAVVAAPECCHHLTDQRLKPSSSSLAQAIT